MDTYKLWFNGDKFILTPREKGVERATRDTDRLNTDEAMFAVDGGRIAGIYRAPVTGFVFAVDLHVQYVDIYHTSCETSARAVLALDGVLELESSQRDLVDVKVLRSALRAELQETLSRGGDSVTSRMVNKAISEVAEEAFNMAVKRVAASRQDR